jgi:hypothetical protein
LAKKKGLVFGSWLKNQELGTTKWCFEEAGQEADQLGEGLHFQQEREDNT